MKNVLIVVALVIVFNAIFVFSGGLDLLVKTEQQAEAPERINADVVDVFRFTLEDEVRKKIGMPIEGYEPAMFLKVLPGLVETDFDGVEASIGEYIVIEGQLEHKLDETKLIHSAAGAVTRAGIETLLLNTSKRIGVDLSTDGTITDIINAITSEG
ncbi:MAG: hypothetical protein ACI92I_000114 [Acidimicrobiales bacterium]|jgi:hypothetical protein